ncbi:copper resistance D family protein [Metabacillus herbersteinensis]|uniref:Copper resistance D family protein n=1 Tax=Metabacillus herbersteinensis TaxID=283816 RepID=A0ABV6GEN8_9BACI
MSALIPITEYLNYVLFSILVGHIVLQFIPESKKPTIVIPKSTLLLSILGIILCSFAPALQVILYFSEGLGYRAAFSILTDFQVGISWIFIGFMATFLWMTIYVEGSKYLQAVWILLMILAVGYSSHVASLYFWEGLITHSLHFLAVTLWTGLLLHVAWLSKDLKNWFSFLKWFTPFAIGCFVLLITTGLLVMFYVVEPRDYMNSWALPYGQMLLLKHISIIPLLLFAFINGFLAKRSLQDETFKPRPWLQAESILLMIVFFITGVLGTQSPPHQVNFTVKSEGAATWVESLIGKEIIPPFLIQVAPSLQGILLVIFSFMFLILIIISFNKKIKSTVALLFASCFIVSLYLGLMMNVTSVTQ